MLIQYRHNRFIALSSYAEKDTLKAAGFRWDKDARQWYTDDAVIAARLAAYCDESAAPHVRGLAEDRKASRATTVADDIDLPCPEGLEYLPFQRAGIAYALDRENVLFGDEMGLGKTIQAIGVINADETIGRVLVICPASLKRNWLRELTRWLTRPLTVGIATSSLLLPADIVILNYDILRQHEQYLKQQRYDLLIADEAHLLKNSATIRAKHTFAVKARRKLALTGTPIVNRPIEAYSLLNWLDRERWHSKAEFQRRYTVWGSPNEGRNLPELQDILRSTLMVRRLKADVLRELPPKRRQIFELETPDEIKMLLRQEDDLAARVFETGGTDSGLEGALLKLKPGFGADFTELSRIRHETAVAKIPFVARHVAELLDDEGVPKVVVFAHHLDVLRALHRELAPYGAVVLTGETSLDDRQRAVDRFQHDDTARVFVASILAAGVGLTLTAADTVVFAELDWVPGNLKQAEDRCHRIGSEVHESILCRYLVFEESLDARIGHTVAEKLRVIEQALDRVTATEVTVVKEAEIGSLAAAPVAGARKVFDDGAYQRMGLTAGVAQSRALQQCVRILAGNDPDGARDRNGVGFNQMDSRFGHALARWEGDLTDNQALSARRLLIKYGRQLPPDLYQLAINGKVPEEVTA